MTLRNNIALGITGLALAAASYSFATPEVQAAPAKQSADLQETEAAAIPTLPLLLIVLQEYYIVVDPVGGPPCPYWIAAAPEAALSDSDLIDAQAQHLLD